MVDPSGLRRCIVDYGQVTGDCRWINASSGRAICVNTKPRAKSTETIESWCIDSARNKFAEPQTHLLVSVVPGGELLKRTESFDFNRMRRRRTMNWTAKSDDPSTRLNWGDTW